MWLLKIVQDCSNQIKVPKMFKKQASMRIKKVSNFVNFLSNNKNFHVTLNKRVLTLFTATKFVQVAQKALVTTAIEVKKNQILQ